MHAAGEGEGGGEVERVAERWGEYREEREGREEERGVCCECHYSSVCLSPQYYTPPNQKHILIPKASSSPPKFQLCKESLDYSVYSSIGLAQQPGA